MNRFLNLRAGKALGVVLDRGALEREVDGGGRDALEPNEALFHARGARGARHPADGKRLFYQLGFAPFSFSLSCRHGLPETLPVVPARAGVSLN